MGDNATVRTDDGRVIPLGEVNFGDFETQGLYKIAADFPDSATANMFLQAYQESEVDVPAFLQVYRDVLRKDMQGGADAQKDAVDSLFGMPPNNDAKGLPKENGLPPFQSVDLASDQVSPLAKGNRSGIMKAVRQQLATDGSKALPGMGNMPFRALAAKGTVTDAGYSNGYQNLMVPGELLSSSSGGGKGPEYGPDDEEVYWEDIQPAPAPTTSPTLTPSSTPTLAPTPYMLEYTTNIGGKSGYARNTNAYPGVNEGSLMPLGYQKQSVSDMGFYEFVYAGGSLKNAKEDGLVDCVGMNRLPGITWFSPSMYEKLKKEGKLSTVVGYLYGNAARKGKMTPEMEDQKFDGMQLISEKTRILTDGTKEKYKNHIVTYYKEITMEFPVGKDLSKFEGCEQTQVRVVYSPDKKQDVQLVTFYDVVVHISGKRDGYVDSRGSVYTGKKVDELNRRMKNEIIIDPYQPGKYQYWCALDYVDYGDQAIPESNK